MKKPSVGHLRYLLLGLLAASALVFAALAIWSLNSLSAKSAQLTDLKLKNNTLDAQLAGLSTAKKEVEKYSYFNDVAKTVLPSDKDQAKAVLTIFKLSKDAGISIASITFPTSNLGNGKASATGSASTAISQALPVPGISGLYSLQLTITSETGSSVSDQNSATYSKLQKFLKSIERDRRTAQITQLNIQPVLINGKPSDAVNFNITINIFMRPGK